MAYYEFLSTWCLDAPIDDVWLMLEDAAAYPTWWKGVRTVELLASGDEVGIGEVNRFSWRSVLPYTLAFDMEVTRVDPLRLLEGRATGELDGVGVWRLFSGPCTAVVYDWRVRTTKAWMNVLGPLVRPGFIWNHDLVMRQGAQGMADALGARLIACD
jgi:polyketide cyclase/dehydrase/lipid transport protein